MPTTILLVDDDPDDRSIYAEALTRRGHRVLTAVHGAEGVHLARTQLPDLVLMDIRMPLMDGWDAIRYLRADPYTAKLPIWAITAYLPEEIARNRPPLSFDRLIAKPIGPTQLVREVEAQLGSPRTPPAA